MKQCQQSTNKTHGGETTSPQKELEQKISAMFKSERQSGST